MRQRLVLLCLLAGLLHAGLAAASGFGLFQHGGRATGQAGAFTARGSEPSALTYNPAAITELPGLQIQGGLDFSNARNEYSSSTGSFTAHHIIDFPPELYITWKAKENPLALGIGLDSPYWYKVDWIPALFPGRFLKRRLEFQFFELHPVAAWDLGEGWSVGGGVRYVYGDFKQGDNRIVPVTLGTVPRTNVEIQRLADAKVDGVSWDAAVHFSRPSWGWGAVYRGEVRLKGNGDVSYEPRDIAVPGLEPLVRSAFPSGSSHQSFEIPREVRSGVWVAPYPELRVEFDVAWEAWSSLDETSITYGPDPVGDGPTVFTRRDWKDTLNLRLGLEGNITDAFIVYGGVSREQSPIRTSTAQPDFPRGDAMVYAVGFSYNFPQLSFDVGYSLHEHDDVHVSGQELLSPGVNGTYSANDKVWAASARWRL